MTSEKDIKKIAGDIRVRIIEMSHDAKTPHLGSSLSCVDILSVLYWKVMSIDSDNPNTEDNDQFILSKGHAASALYATLAFKGFFPKEMLNDYAKNASVLAEHPGPSCVPGIKVATGSLGHGLSIGLGMALAAKIKKKGYRVFVVMSDGECNEGTVWEAALLGASNKLDNVVAIIDYNKWQATGRSNKVMALVSLKEKWRAFGWDAYEIDGHDIKQLIETLESLPKDNEKPKVIIANTIKGKGVSFMEDDNNWHYRIPTEEEVKRSKKELRLL